MVQYDNERLQAVRAIESLRAGVPTRHTTRALPDLRPQLMDTIQSDLRTFRPDNPPAGRLFWGQYGQGKSHFLALIEHCALDEKFAVSRITLSREVSCHNLFYFFRRVAPIVSLPDSNVPGLESKLFGMKASELPSSPIQQPDRYPHQLPAIVLECLLSRGVTPDAVHNLYDDLMGYRLPLSEIRRCAKDAGISDLMRNLPRFRMTDHATAYFGLLADVMHLCGYRGWVILIDEVELICRLGRVGRLNAYRNLHWLLNWSGAMRFPIYTVGAAAMSLREVWFTGNNR